MNKLNDEEKNSDQNNICSSSNVFFNKIGLDEEYEKGLDIIHKSAIDLGKKKHQKIFRLSKFFEENKQKILENSEIKINNIEFIKEQENLMKKIVLENSQKSILQNKKKLEKNNKIKHDKEQKEQISNDIINKLKIEINELNIVIEKNKEIKLKYEEENNKMKNEISLLNSEIQNLQKIIDEQKIKMDSLIKKEESNLKMIKGYKAIIENIKATSTQKNEKEIKYKKEFEQNLEKLYKNKVETEIKKINLIINQNLEEKLNNLKSIYEKNYQNNFNQLIKSLESKLIPKSQTEIKRNPNNKKLDNSAIINQHKNINEDNIKKEEPLILFKCSNLPYLNRHLYEGARETKLNITLENIGDHTWPLNCKLKLEFNQFIKIDDIYLSQQKPKEMLSYEIKIKISENCKAGIYEAFLCFCLNDKIIGDKMKIKIIIQSNKKEVNLGDSIKKFRKEYTLLEKDYDDEKLGELLKKNNFDFAKSFSNLFA